MIPALKSISIAKALVVDPNNHVLVLYISDTHPVRPHTSDFPGGFVEEGESETDGVVRELLEETSIRAEITDLRLCYAETNSDQSKNESVTKLVYVLKVSQRPEVILSWEHEKYIWIPVSELINLPDLRPFYRQAIEYISKYNLA